MRFLILLLFTSLNVQAQDFSDSWQGFFSYNEIVDIVPAGDAVFVAGQNAIFSFDIATNSIETLNTVNGLDGRAISKIYYSTELEALLIGYVDGLLQIVQNDGKIITVVAILDKLTIPANRKRINDFREKNGLIYIATDFGIALYDLARLEFNDTYFIGNNADIVDITGVEIVNNTIYATSVIYGGIRRADITNPFLLDFTNWTQINTGSFSDINAFNNQVYASQGSSEFVLQGAAFAFSRNLPATIRRYSSSVANRSITLQDRLIIENTGGAVVNTIIGIPDVSSAFTTGILNGQNYFIGTKDDGMFVNATTSTTIPQQVFPDGPIRNNAFSLTALPGELWVAHGNHSAFFNPDPLDNFGVSHLTPENGWQNLRFTEILNAQSIASITINTQNTDEVFLNSMDDGIVRINDTSAPFKFDNTNSTLEVIPGTGIRVSESIFDSSGNLWALNLQRNNGLHRKTPGNQWTAFNLDNEIEGIGRRAGLGSLVINNSDQLFFGSTDNGVVAYDIRNNRYGNLLPGIGQGNLINQYVSALAVDQRNALWIGSNLGIRIFSNASSIFEETFQDARSVIVENSDGIPRELLDDIGILDIEVDGNNNKWVATTTSGALLLSPSGRETLQQFTKENSPLPDNQVRDIALDESTGIVYFATDNGIVAFKGNRTSEPSESLENVFAFPNPVRPNYEGNVTIDGLTVRARIKITDIEGNLVFETVSNGGSVQWDTRSFSGNKVASGVYLLFISANDNIETKVSKLMIIR